MRRGCKTYMFVMGIILILAWMWIVQIMGPDTDWRQTRIRESVKMSIQESNGLHSYMADKREDVLTKLAELAVAVHGAKKHARGTKTLDYLHTAVAKLDFLLDSFNINKTVLLKRNEIASTSVCPEKYMGSTYGYPFFYKGFEETACAFGKRITDLITVIAIDGDGGGDPVQTRTETFLKSVLSIHSNIPIIIATNRKTQLHKLLEAYPSISYLDNLRQRSDGAMFNEMVRIAGTPYVFVTKYLDRFTNDSRLSRLVREIESLGVSVAGGAWRNRRGHWSHGCYQSVNRNYTLNYVYGYDESMHECLFCDHVTGPFVSSRNTLLKYPFKSYNMNDGLFEDWFLNLKRMNKETIVCPDAMFHMRTRTAEQDFGKFMADMRLHEIQTVNGKTIRASCNREKNEQSKSLSPCNVKSNAALVKFIMSICEESNIICELQEGTALGAVKFGKVLPWERDADLTFLSGNFSAFESLKSRFTEKQIGFKNAQPQWCCADNRTAGGVFTLSASGWTVEMYGQHVMDSETLRDQSITSTKVLFDGQWVNVPRNPGLFVRNRYGRETFQHALHWMTTGAQNGWEPYKTNVFMECSNPGDHDCLDRYNTDGSLTFEYILP